MNGICRLCFVVEKEIINFHSEEAERLNIKDIILKHFCFQIQHNDLLPKFVCSKCWNRVQVFHDFYNTVVEKTHLNILHKSNSLIDKNLNLINDNEYNNNSNVVMNPINNVNIINDVDVPDDNSIKSFKIKSEWCAVDSSFTIPDVDNVIANGFPFVNVKIENDNEMMVVVDEQHYLLGNNASKLIKTNKNDKVVTIQKKKKCIKSKFVKQILNKTVSIKYGSAPDQNIIDSKINMDKQSIKNNTVSVSVNKRVRDDAKIREFYNLSCTICSVTFFTITELRTHYLSVHNLKNGSISCCNKKISKRCNLLEHIDWHLNPNAFKCKICHKLFNAKYGLKLHMHFHSKPEDRHFYCDLCNESFTMRYHLMKHFRDKHITKAIKEFQCSKCDKCFKKYSILQYHIRGVHELKNVHICHICAKSYKSKAQCQIHVNVDHSDKLIPKENCNLCGSVLKDKLSLKNHIRRIHNDPPIICRLCGKTIANKNAYGNHMRNIHMNLREFKCNLCEKVFKRAISLKEHTATHSGTSILYTCSYCPTSFNFKANLYKHRKKNHPEVWLAERSKRYATVVVSS